jgi:hypothetical protein
MPKLIEAYLSSCKYPDGPVFDFTTASLPIRAITPATRCAFAMNPSLECSKPIVYEDDFNGFEDENKGCRAA